MNILYIDMDKYDVDTTRRIFEQIKEVVDGDIICLPTDAKLFIDVDLSHLRFLRDILSNAIKEKETD